MLRRDSSASPQNDKYGDSPIGIGNNSATSGFASGKIRRPRAVGSAVFRVSDKSDGISATAYYAKCNTRIKPITATS